MPPPCVLREVRGKSWGPFGPISPGPSDGSPLDALTSMADAFWI